MLENAYALHLLRDGELIEAVVTRRFDPRLREAESCHLELTYRGRTITAIGCSIAEALVALRGTVAREGILMNVHQHGSLA